MKKICILPVCLITFCFIWAANVYGLRCGNNIVDVGDPKIEVLHKCGEPATVDQWDEEERISVSAADQSGQGRRTRSFVSVEQWTYNFGSTRFLYILIFRNGELSEIKTGDHGF